MTANLTMSDIAIGYHDTSRGTDISIVEHLDLSVAPAEMHCLAGRSGSGKTSLLKVAAGLVRPQKGTVRWQGKDISGLPEREIVALRLRHVGYMDQGSQLVEDLTVLENVLLPVLPEGRSAVKASRNFAVDLLSTLGVATLRGNYPENLSGGERQRVALARALVKKPEILIIDEPTASLDRHWADRVISTLESVRMGGTAILVASHDPAVRAAAGRSLDLDSRRPDVGILTS